MNRIFLASQDRMEMEWLSEELKEFGRIVRYIESLDFFIPQWETSDSNILIVAEGVVVSDDSFIKLIEKVKSETPRTSIILLYHRDEDDFIKKLIHHDVSCISYYELEPGLVESRLTGNDPHSMFIESLNTADSDLESDNAVWNSDEELEAESLIENWDEIDPLYSDIEHNRLEEKGMGISKALVKSSSKVIKFIDTIKAQAIENKKNKTNEYDSETFQIDILPEPKVNMRRQRFVGTALIAITGTEYGVGCTHTAIMIANHLASQNYTVALVEANGRNDFVEIEAAYEGIENSKQIRTAAFNIHGVRYFKNVQESNIPQLLSESFSYIVLNLGNNRDTSWYQEFLRANIQIIVGAGIEWKQKEIINFFHNQIHQDQSRWRLCIPFASKQTINDLKKRLPKRKIYSLPFHTDPYEQNKELSTSIERILSLNQQQRLNLLKKKMQSIFK